MGRREADQLLPDTLEEEGTVEMEKSMSNSEGTILQILPMCLGQGK